MGLFNRNKGEASAPSTLGAVNPPASNENFDFNAISRDLDAQNGASSFDSLLATPVKQNQQPQTQESAFNVTENDPLGLSTPDMASPEATAPIATSPDAVINAPLNSPTTGVAPVAPISDATAPPTPVTPVAKKSLPLIPLLGALGLLAVAGGGAMFLLSSNSTQDQGAPPPMAPPSVRPPAASGAPGVAGAPSTSTATSAIVPGSSATSTAPRTSGEGLRSASPGIAPPAAAKQPLPTSLGASNVSITTGNPASKAPSATVGLDSALASKLKALWQAGADAKHKKDYAGARAAWGEALRLRPGHPGFQDSINKLPK